MKNRFYSVIVLLMIMMYGNPIVYAAFPVTENVAAVEAAVAPAPPAVVEQPATRTKAPERMQSNRGGRATAAGAGFGIAALACGVGGLLIAAIPLGVCAIVFGVIGLNRRLKGLAIAGLTLGIIDVLVGMIILASVL